MKIKVKAFAKINLSLDITGKRADGYHLLKMIMQSVSLHDIITLTNTLHNNEITISCSDSNIPCDKRNITYKAAENFFHYTEINNPGIAINIEKHIPSEAGLAGGSTDGAAVIAALNSLFDTGLSEEQMCCIGLKTGADIPFCLTGGTMLVEGIGDNLKRLSDLKSCFILLAKPSWGISTKEAYCKFDSKAEYTHPDVYGMADAIKAGDNSKMSTFISNIFEQTDNFEPVNRLKETMNSCGALGCAMTGSGSAVFGIFDVESLCHECSKKIGSEIWNTVCTPVNRGYEFIL